MLRKSLSPTALRLLALLFSCASLQACWWDGHDGTGTATETIGGTISGLSSSGLVLANGTDRLSAAAGATTFTFLTAVPAGSTYSVTVATQPAGESCTVSSGSGTASSAVATVKVVCTAMQYHLGGTLSGLTAAGLVLANGTDTVSPAANATAFTFPTGVISGATYQVTVSMQPSGLTCTISAGSGTFGAADVNSVAVTCAPASFQVGGTISGLTAAGLVLANGADTVSPAVGATTFTLPAAVTSGATYVVTVQTQPTGLTCGVVNGNGTVGTSNVTTIAVSCSAGTGFTPLAGQVSCPLDDPDQNGTGAAASLPVPYSLQVDSAGNVYTAGLGVVDKITPAAVVTTLAGQYNTYGYTDGTGRAALFQNVFVGGVDGAGNVYLSESSNIRRVTPAGVVSTVAGPATSEQGYVDGTGSDARFDQWGLGVTADGTAYVADYANHVIRKVSSTGVTTTLAGQRSQAGDLDGIGAAAQFEVPQYAAVDATGTTYISDLGGIQVRKITADGTVTTVAGGTVNGWADGQGTTARFYGIQAIAIGPLGSIYVLDQPSLQNGSNPHATWGAVRQISTDGTVKTIAVSTAANSYFAIPAGTHLTISQPLQSIGTASSGTLFAASGCAVGPIVFP